ncbi:MAG: hypothetical protein HC828_21600, partial [Blastochloris sp.]|nr:hypothetical protein [Blastochloris sp.]
MPHWKRPTIGAQTPVVPGVTPSPTGATGQTASPTPTTGIAAGPRVTLYFADGATGQVYIPIERAVNAPSDQLPAAAVRELITGPRSGSNLQPVLRSDV